MNFNKVNNWDAFTPSPDYIGADPSFFPYWPRPISGRFYVMIANTESIGQKINLLANVNYRIQFKAVGLWGQQNIIEIYGLDDEPIILNSGTNTNYFTQNAPQWTSNIIIGDTIWHSIESCFKASKNIKYLVFVPKATSMWIAIDDVIVEEAEQLINTKETLPIDTIICDNLLGLELKPVGLDSILTWSDGSKSATFIADTTGNNFLPDSRTNAFIAILFLFNLLKVPE